MSPPSLVDETNETNVTNVTNVTTTAASIPQTDAASIYQVHVHQVSRWAERLAGPYLDVEDIVQEVFIIAYERMPSFRGDSTLATWLFGITDRVVRHRRRKERWRRWLSGSADETAGHLPSNGSDPSRGVERDQAAAAVYRVLDRLNERDRQILILCELEEMSTDEVAALLKIQPTNVRVRLHRARTRFVQAYKDCEGKQSNEEKSHVIE
jgi:RNA polymerase sigma-70 factor (ECF subfamily)